jgi:hypothetical protein
VTNLDTELDEQLFAAACAGFGREPTDEFRKDVTEHVRDGVLYVIFGKGAALGFAVMKDYPEISATYISGIVKGPGTTSGIVERIVIEHARNFKTVVVRTQNDRVVEIMKNICDEVVPINREAEEKEIKILEEMGLFSPNLRADLVVPGHYGGSPMIGNGDRRRSQDIAVKRTTDRLNYEKGDALLLIGYRR